MREQKRNWWKRFLRARRKRDAVKITLFLAVAAVGFGAAAISRGVTLYRQVNMPVEYVLRGNSKQIPKLEELAHFAAASPQQEQTLTVQEQGQEYHIPYITLSKEYLEIVYGIKPRGATATFYMNSAALRTMGAEAEERLVSGFLEESGGDDTSAAVRPQNQVKLMPAEGILDQHAPMTVTVAESGNALTGEGQVRVCFRRRDLDGSQKQQMEKLGFLLENQTDVLEAEYQKETLLLRMKYEALIGALLGIGAVAVYKYGKK